MNTIDDKLNYLVENGGGGGSLPDIVTYFDQNIAACDGNGNYYSTQEIRLLNAVPGLYIIMMHLPTNSAISYGGNVLKEKILTNGSIALVERIYGAATIVPKSNGSPCIICAVPVASYTTGVNYFDLIAQGKIGIDFDNLVQGYANSGSITLNLSAGRYICIATFSRNNAGQSVVSFNSTGQVIVQTSPLLPFTVNGSKIGCCIVQSNTDYTVTATNDAERGNFVAIPIR